MAKVHKTSAEVKSAIQRKSAYSLPNNPTDSGFKASDIRNAFYKPIIDITNSALTEIDRIVEELNGVLGLATKDVDAIESVAGLNYHGSDGLIYSFNGSAFTVSGNDELEGEVSIPSSVFYQDNYYPVVAIAANAFNGSKITKAEIASSVETIGEKAFYTTTLASVKFCGSTSIGASAFYAGRVAFSVPNEYLSAYESSLASYKKTLVGFDTIANNALNIAALFRDKVDKIIGESANERAYIISKTGAQITRKLVTTPTDGEIPVYLTGGRIPVKTPQTDDDATPRGYVEDRLESMGAYIAFSIDPTNYKMTIQLKNEGGTILSSGSVDLPLESVVVGGSYSEGEVILELENGNTISFPITSLVDGLVEKIRPTKTLNPCAYTTNADGVQGICEISENADGLTLGLRDRNGAMKVAPPTEPEDAVNLQYVDNLITPLQESSANHEKRIETLEGLLLTTTTDTTEAYDKPVPLDVAPTATLDSVGGQSVASANKFNPQVLEGLGVYEIYPDGGIARMVATGDSLPHHDIAYITLPAGTWYISCTGTGARPSAIFNYDVFSFSVTLAVETRVPITLEYGEANKVYSTPFYIMISDKEGEAYSPYFKGLRTAPVTEVISRDAEGNELATVAIPAEVQALENYGKAFTTVDFDKKQFIDASHTVILTGEEDIGYYLYGGKNSVLVYVAGNVRPRDTTMPKYITNEHCPQSEAWFWFYFSGFPVAWIGALDVLGFTSSWADKSNPTADEKNAAIASFKQWLAARYASGNPVTIVYEVKEPTITNISADLTDYDDFKDITVKAGGTVEFVNERKIPVPSTITYVTAKE